MGGGVVTRLWFVLLVVVWSNAVRAQDTVQSFAEANRVISRAATVGPTWMPPSRSATDGLHIGRDFLFPAPGGRSAAARAVVRLGVADAVTLAARALAGPWVTAATVAAALLEDYRIQHPSVQSGIEYLEHDVGVPPAQGTIYQWRNDTAGPAGPYGSVNTACTELIAYHNNVSNTSGGPNYYTFLRSEVATNGLTATCWRKIIRKSDDAVVDAEDYFAGLTRVEAIGALPCPDGPMYRDGRCATGTYTPISVPGAVAVAMAYPPPMTDAEYEEILDEVFSRLPSQAVSGLPEAELRINVLDSPLGGPVTTTTEADGTVIQESVVWNIGRVADTLRDSETSEWSETRTRTTTSPTGVTSTTTTTSTGTSAPVVGTEAAPVDACPEGSTASGCAILGTPPETTLTPEARDVTWVQENLGLPAQCPAPLNFNVRSWSMSMDWTPACDIAPLIRAGILAMTLLGVAFFLVSTVNKS